MDLIPFSLDLESPLSTAAGDITARRGFLVRVFVDGHTGLGEATPLPGWTESLDACETALNAVAERVETGAYDAATAALSKNPAAKHGLALAIADARARAAGVPLYRHLGGEKRVERVPVNATIGAGSLETTVDAAERAVASGFRTLKLKVGTADVAADVARVAAVRDAVGPDIELRADANGAWDRRTARSALDGFADADFALVEQPLAPADITGHATLRGGFVKIGLDESLAERSIEEVLAAEAADVLVLKPMALGGPQRTRAVAMQAKAAGVEPVVTTTIDAAVARTAAVHVAASIPDIGACGLATADLLASDVLDEDPAPVVDGAVRVPQGKGNTGTASMEE
ncbi:mandelate racemase/muconate lactonizing enzyme family protein [Haladaptatus sp. GCM10025707]|uniref:mandelate racemase/muconate lactonizing enzyme family protein n=1 Tax=unclassified Haladaptatus TaxID=2622732 RepID=UPI0023E7F929|nr:MULTISPECIES: o-succinylbenzoate synthase [unclassified Haladaptatus]